MKILISDFGMAILYSIVGSMLIGLFAVVLSTVTSY